MNQKTVMNKKTTRLLLFILMLSVFSSLPAGCAVKNEACELCGTAHPEKECAEQPGMSQYRETVTDVLDSIRDYRPGVLGSSLKIQITAFAFIDFSQEDAASDLAAFENIAGGYVAALTEEDLGFFKETVSRIEEIASQLFTDGLESLLPILDDAGNPQKHEKYNEEKYASLMGALKNVLE